MFECKVCGKQDPKHIWYCEEHYKCIKCGTKEDLVLRTEGPICGACFDKIIEFRIATFDGDTDYTDEVICPNCGHKHSDSWEMQDGEYDCGECGKPFVVVIDVDITYCTYKKEA
ncbi:MAG: hypothetical protein WA151_13920 [Desulfatirhabdiaceae bacterium]